MAKNTVNSYVPTLGYVIAITALYAGFAVIVGLGSTFVVFVFAHPYAGLSAVISFVFGVAAGILSRHKSFREVRGRFASAMHAAHHSA